MTTPPTLFEGTAHDRPLVLRWQRVTVAYGGVLGWRWKLAELWRAPGTRPITPGLTSVREMAPAHDADIADAIMAAGNQAAQEAAYRLGDVETRRLYLAWVLHEETATLRIILPQEPTGNPTWRHVVVWYDGAAAPFSLAEGCTIPRAILRHLPGPRRVIDVL